MSNTHHGPTPSPLTRAVLEIDEYASGLGWDQPARLFALVDTAGCAPRSPASPPSSASRATSPRPPLTPIEQDELPAGTAAGRVARHHRLAGRGRRLRADRGAADAAAVRRGADPAGPERRGSWRWVAEHPERQEVRMTVGGAARRHPGVGAAAAREGLADGGAHRRRTWCRAWPRRCRRRSRTDVSRAGPDRGAARLLQAGHLVGRRRPCRRC